MIVASNAVLIAETVALAAKTGVDATQLALPLQVVSPTHYPTNFGSTHGNQ